MKTKGNFKKGLIKENGVNNSGRKVVDGRSRKELRAEGEERIERVGRREWRKFA